MLPLGSCEHISLISGKRTIADWFSYCYFIQQPMFLYGMDYVAGQYPERTHIPTEDVRYTKTKSTSQNCKCLTNLTNEYNSRCKMQEL